MGAAGALRAIAVGRCTAARCPPTRRSSRSPARSTPTSLARRAPTPSGSARSSASPPSGTARSGSARRASWPRSRASSARWACTRSASTTCATPRRRPVPVVSTAFRPGRRRRAGAQPVPRLHLACSPPPTGGSSTADLQRAAGGLPRPARAVRPRAARARRPRRGRAAASSRGRRALPRAGDAAFELSREPVDEAWYRELEAVSAVAADIGGVALHAHQPPHPARPRHRRALRADAGAAASR